MAASKILLLIIFIVCVQSLPAKDLRSTNQGQAIDGKKEVASEGAKEHHVTKRSAPNCPNNSCSLKAIEMFVATSHHSSAASPHQHEFWIRVKSRNHYYMLPVPPGVGAHATWTLDIADFRPNVAGCISDDDIEEMFFKERSNDAWVIQAVTIHYLDWCDKKTIGPDHHHFNKWLDGDNTPSNTIHDLL